MSAYKATLAIHVKIDDVIDHDRMGMCTVLDVWKLPTGDIEIYLKNVHRKDGRILTYTPDAIFKVVQ